MKEMIQMNNTQKIEQGKTCLGIELGSTRIKAVLIDECFSPIASGSSEWENRLCDGIWTYSLDDICGGLQSCYANLAANVKENYGATLKKVGAMGISAMMHGYMAFDKNGNLLVPFRTWRNTITEQAASELTSRLGFNIPQRWTAAHLYQAVLNGEEHVPQIEYVTTLAGYIHFMLTGKRVVGIGEASGIFPVENGSYNRGYADIFNSMLAEKGFCKEVDKIFPSILFAGENAGFLTEEGAKFIDPTGALEAGIPFCPPEGDAGTGMTAANAILPKTGNVSAGTSIFSMLVLEKPLKGVYPKIDIVTTPDGFPTAMVHCNNCCSELDVWVKMFGEFAELCGNGIGKSELYELLYKNALENGNPSCGGVTAYNFLSGEPVADTENGRPMYFRTPNSKMNLANFLRAQLYSSMAALKIGMDILFEEERVSAEQFTAHGGLFKTRGVAQQFLADALNTPISVMKTAGEGGAWGMALLAAFMDCGGEKSLPDWLNEEVFSGMEESSVSPAPAGVCGFEEFMKRYKNGLRAERCLAE